MKFRMLLWYMARRMEILARTNAEFIAKLHGRDFVIQIATDEGTERFFRIHHNRVASRDGRHATPDLTLHFASDDIGLRLLMKGDANAFMAAVQTQEVALTGDYALLMWFMSVGKFLRPRLRLRRSAHDSGAARSAG
jgi:hypothetical protein